MSVIRITILVAMGVFAVAQIPTAVPTAEPTFAPTVIPTIAPTAAPSSSIDHEYLDEFYYNGNNAAYTWDYAYPQACSCKETGVPLSQCTLFKCDCICDVTAGKCDYNCCCDPDCSDAQISRFSDANGCSVAGVAATTEYCYDSTHLAKINPRSTLSGQPTSISAVSNALCVQKKNIASANEYYTDTSVEDSTIIFKTSSGSKDYDYIEVVTESTPDAYFDQNDTIPVFILDGSDVVPMDATKYMLLPSANDFNQQCNDNNYAKFEVDVNSNNNRCTRQLVVDTEDSHTLESQCTGIVSINRYVSDVLVATEANVGTTSVSATINNTVSVTINSMIYVDYVTGVETDLSASYWEDSTCVTTYYSDYATYISSSPTDCQTAAITGLTSTNTDNSPICSGFVTSIVYYVKHDQTSAASIFNVYADVKISDVPLMNTTTSGVSTSIAASVEQSFGIHYMDIGNGNVSPSTTLGNIVNRSRSGNPGYFMGSNIVYGLETTNDTVSNNSPTSGTVIDEYIDGLQLMKPSLNTIQSPTLSSNNLYANGISSKSTCPTSFDSNSNEVGPLYSTFPVKFGYDTITGCMIRLNRTALENICSTSTTNIYTNPTTDLPYFLEFTNGSVGIYGNADPLDVSQWISLEKSTPNDNAYTGSMVWNSDTSTCTGFPTGLNIKFLVAYSGEKVNPQNKIIAASYEYTSIPWKMRFPRSDTTAEQSFPLTVTVSYIFKYHQQLIGYQPPAPPLLFEVPWDVFYPFVSNSASPSSTASFWNINILITALILLSITLHGVIAV